VNVQWSPTFVGIQPDELWSLVMLVPGESLRRHVARALWFDISDNNGKWRSGVEWVEVEHRLKLLADPERLDAGFEFDTSDLRDALLLVGYDELRVDKRMEVHCQQRRRMESNVAMPEIERVARHTGGPWTHYDYLGVGCG